MRVFYFFFLIALTMTFQNLIFFYSKGCLFIIDLVYHGKMQRYFFRSVSFFNVFPIEIGKNALLAVVCRLSVRFVYSRSKIGKMMQIIKLFVFGLGLRKKSR